MYTYTGHTADAGVKWAPEVANKQQLSVTDVWPLFLDPPGTINFIIIKCGVI
jgi:hypothetical protein